MSLFQKSVEKRYLNELDSVLINKSIKQSSGEKLTKSDEMEWMEVFENNKIDAQNLKSEIEKTDKEINGLVYVLYSLSDEEIKIVEGSK